MSSTGRIRTAAEAGLDDSVRRPPPPQPHPSRHSCKPLSLWGTSKETAIAIDSEEERDTEEFECSICLENPDLKEIATIDSCSHRFCVGCIQAWKKRSNLCPMCNAKFDEIKVANSADYYLEEKDFGRAIRLTCVESSMKKVQTSIGHLWKKIQDCQELIININDVYMTCAQLRLAAQDLFLSMTTIRNALERDEHGLAAIYIANATSKIVELKATSCNIKTSCYGVHYVIQCCNDVSGEIVKLQSRMKCL